MCVCVCVCVCGVCVCVSEREREREDCTFGHVREKETLRGPPESRRVDIQMKGELMKTTCHIFSPALSRNRK